MTVQRPMLHAVTDLTDVVDLRAVADRGVGELAPVDRASGTDLDVPADPDRADLRNLHERATIRRRTEAEAIRADRDVRVEDAAVTDLAPLADDHAGPDRAPGADDRVLQDRDLGMDDRPLADAREGRCCRTGRPRLRASRASGMNRRAGIDPHRDRSHRRREELEHCRQSQVAVRHPDEPHAPPLRTDPDRPAPGPR